MVRNRQLLGLTPLNGMDESPSLLFGRYSTVFRLYNRPRWRWKEKKRLRQYHGQHSVMDVIKVNQSLELKPLEDPGLRELVEGSDEDGLFLVQYTKVELVDKSIKLAPDQRTAIELALKELGIGENWWLKCSKSLATAPEHPLSKGKSLKSLRNGCTDTMRTSLELLSQTSDVFPPLKSAVGGVLALWDLVERVKDVEDEARALLQRANETILL
ncbi:hypothetical protein BC827DRAFT_1376429 [Russula dissimulans]|nr:hypothetical protein BC827DRAFT_1376429 [Russula dissimulans]